MFREAFQVLDHEKKRGEPLVPEPSSRALPSEVDSLSQDSQVRLRMVAEMLKLIEVKK